jgi:DNA-binding NarL/FixJ family response regulator
MKKKLNKPESKKKILIVDDHPLVRKGIATLISQEPDLEVSGEAASAHEALLAMKKCKPDVALVDLTLKDSSGLELIKDIQIQYPKVRILVLSMRDEGFYAERVLRAGAMGYIIKEEGGPKVIDGIRKVISGQIYVSDKMATKVMEKIIGGKAESASSTFDELSDRELEIFEFIGNGLATREIAKKLNISPKTVESHREHIKQKLKLETAAELTKQAIQWVQCQKNI